MGPENTNYGGGGGQPMSGSNSHFDKNGDIVLDYSVNPRKAKSNTPIIVGVIAALLIAAIVGVVIALKTSRKVEITENTGETISKEQLHDTLVKNQDSIAGTEIRLKTARDEGLSLSSLFKDGRGKDQFKQILKSYDESIEAVANYIAEGNDKDNDVLDLYENLKEARAKSESMYKLVVFLDSNGLRFSDSTNYDEITAKIRQAPDKEEYKEVMSQLRDSLTIIEDEKRAYIELGCSIEEQDYEFLPEHCIEPMDKLVDTIASFERNNTIMKDYIIKITDPPEQEEERQSLQQSILRVIQKTGDGSNGLQLY